MNNDEYYFNLICNKNIISNNNSNYKDLNYLKEYIKKKFELSDKYIVDLIYINIDNYINTIDIDTIIVKEILNNIIDNIILNG